MSAKQKNILLSMTYFTLAAITIAFCVLFMIFLSTQTTAIYQQVMYYVLSSLVVLLVVLDIIFTIIKANKYITGMLIYLLTLLTIIMGCILYGLMNVDGAIVANNLFGYIGMMALSYMVTIMLIVVYCVGEKLISNSVKIMKRKNIND